MDGIPQSIQWNDTPSPGQSCVRTSTNYTQVRTSSYMFHAVIWIDVGLLIWSNKVWGFPTTCTVEQTHKECRYHVYTCMGVMWQIQSYKRQDIILWDRNCIYSSYVNLKWQIHKTHKDAFNVNLTKTYIKLRFEMHRHIHVISKVKSWILVRIYHAFTHVTFEYA